MNEQSMKETFEGWAITEGGFDIMDVDLWTGGELSEEEGAEPMLAVAWEAYQAGAATSAGAVEALRKIAAIENQMVGGDWEEIEEAREIARAALSIADTGNKHD